MFKENNRVIIMIWHSFCNKIRKGESCGHVAIKIPNLQAHESDSGFYVSLWPQGHPSGGVKTFFETRKPHFMSDYQSDEEAENRPPETIICLYSLKPSAIRNKFEKIKSKLQGWTLLGSNKIINNGSAESCASLAYKLLDAGGIYTLVSSSHSSKLSITAVPDDLADFVRNAKAEELKEYKYTQKYKFPGETLIKPKKSSCSVM